MYGLLEKNKVVKYPINIGYLQKQYPSISFPSTFDEFDYKSFNIVKIEDVSPPEYDSISQRVIESDPIQVNGAWLRNWVVEELDDVDKNQNISFKAQEVRAKRDRKLVETDWRVIVEVEKAAIDGLGIQYPTAWADYRQALRDITKQPGFPLTVDWPVPPQ